VNEPTADGDRFSGSGVKSADRVISILEYLAEAGQASFVAIVRDLGLPNSSAHELLQTTLNRGFIEFDEATRQFGIGLRLWEVAQAYSATDSLAVLAQPLMDRLTQLTLETVQLARLRGLQNVYLAISESPHPMKLVSSVGARLPAHATGLGKVLLAGLSDEELHRRLDGVTLASFTDRTLSDHDVLLADLRRIRSRGYGEDNEEYAVGCRCIAMPIHDKTGGVVAAMSVSIPTPRYNASVARDVRKELAHSVARLEERLGLPPRR
jgi:IclR family KDG regulon transcriptional repressor